jgi:hypothetical protein
MPAGNAQILDDAFSQAIASASVEATTTVNVSATVTREQTFPRFYRQYSEPAQKWQIDVQRQLLEQVQMPHGWDGYGTPAPTMDAAFFALLVLSKVMRSRTPIPQVVPSSAGGIQLEWHDKGIDLELHISAPYQCEMWFEDHQKGTAPTSLPLSTDFSPLNGPINLLTVR